VWRFAHNHNGGCYYGEGFAQISNDGNWALFSSYWDGTLGPDTAFGCQTRIDTFIIGLTNITTPPPAPPVGIATSALPTATQGAAYNTTLTASGGTAPFKWLVSSGSMPAGLSLASTTGVISGSPTVNGTFNVSVQVVDAKAQSASAVLILNINPQSTQPLVITTSALPNATQGAAYSTTLTASGGTPPYTWSVIAGSLPAGLSLALSTGAIAGNPTVNGTFSLTVQVADSRSQSASTVLSLTINSPALVITTTAVPTATQGVAYSTTLAASGGTPPYTWSVTAGALPSGLTLASSTGVISGSATVNGTFSFTVQVVDSKTQNASAVFNLTINPPTLAIATSALPTATQGIAYSATLAAAGGTTPYTWSVTVGSLPAGLTLSSSTGVISGSATVNGTFSFTVQVVDARAQNANAALSLTINPPALVITTSTLPNATQGVAYSATLTASGGTPPYTWSVTVGALPSGLTLASSTGVISGSATVNGTFSFTVQVGDSKAQSVSTVLSLTINPPALVITTSALPNATQGIAYTTALAASGGTPPYTWSVIAGSLPGGLTLASNTGVISGSSNVNGTFSFTVQVADARAQNANAALSLTINPPALVIMTSTLPNATQGIAYSTTLSAAGGTPPYMWSVTAGALPSGLTLASSTGVISGSATVNGTFSFTVQVVDARAQSASTALNLTINPPAPPTITLVQAAQKEGSAVASVVAAFPSNNTAGNLIIAFVRMSTTSQTVAITDTLGNSYTEAVSQPQAADGHQIHVFYAKNILGGANTVTAIFSSTNNHPWMTVYEYSGLDTANPLDQTAKSQGSGSVVNTGPTATISVANELVFAATGLPASYVGTAIAGTGYTLTQQDSGTSRAANENELATALQPVTGRFTLSASTSWSAVVTTFRPFGAPPPPPSPPVITTSALPSATQGASYNATVTASGGTPPYAWSVTGGSLPPGLTLDSSTGVITGSPTSGGTSTFTVQVVDARGQNASATLSLTVNPPGFQPITLVQSAATEASGVSSISAPFSSANAAGNLIIAFVRMSSTSQTVTVTDSAGNIYIDAISQVQTADGHQVHIFYAKNVAGSANTVTAHFSAANNHPWIAVYEYSGLNTTAPLDTTAHAQGSGSTASTGATPSTTSSNELVFAATGLPASYTGSVSAGTGYALTQQDTGASRAANEAASTSSTGSVTGTFSLGSATNWTAVVATFMR
jgi:hypothetical protein